MGFRLLAGMHVYGFAPAGVFEAMIDAALAARSPTGVTEQSVCFGKKIS